MTSPDAHVRTFRPDDLGAVERLWRDAGISPRVADAPDQIAVKLQRDPELFVVAEAGGAIVGVLMGAWDGRRGWLYRLAVDPAWRRRGVARSLVAEVERRMRAKGVLEAYGLVFEDNDASLRLFQSLGYVARRDLIVIEKRLDGAAPTGPRAD